MSFLDRKPEEIRAWIDEDDIAGELVDHLYETREALKEAIVGAARIPDPARGGRYVGGHDEIGKLIAFFERKPETKK